MRNLLYQKELTWVYGSLVAHWEFLFFFLGFYCIVAFTLQMFFREKLADLCLQPSICFLCHLNVEGFSHVLFAFPFRSKCWFKLLNLFRLLDYCGFLIQVLKIMFLSSLRVLSFLYLLVCGWKETRKSLRINLVLILVSVCFNASLLCSLSTSFASYSSQDINSNWPA